MPTAQYTALANITLGSSAASVTFNSFTAGFRDLVLVMTGTASSQTGLQMRFNGDNTETNYTRVNMIGDGSSASSGSSSNSSFGSVYTAQGQNIATIMDFSATDKHKSILWRSDSAGNFSYATAGRWANTAAITSLSVYCSGATFSAGSTFALYGVK